MLLERLLKRVFLPILLLLGITAFAQDKTVTGKVTDSSGTGLQAVSVTIKGKNTGVQTAADGSFTLRVPAGSTTLVISSVGYATQQVPLDAASNILLVQTNAGGINDVVVIGYGT